MRYFLVIFLFIVYGCEEVVQLDLSESESRIVIEGTFSDKNNIHHVQISRSIGFYDDTICPPVEGAEVILTGDKGFREVLNEFKPGMYVTSYIKGQSGKHYTLTVNVDGQTYSSTSYMPEPIKKDSVYVMEENFEWWENKKRGYRMYCEFLDPQEKGTYLMLRANVRGETQGGIFLFSDEYVNGDLIKYKFRDIDIYKNNIVYSELWSIDKVSYNYLKSLRNVVADDKGGGMTSPFGMMPANPDSNFTNGALGYFIAYSLKTSNRAVAR